MHEEFTGPLADFDGVDGGEIPAVVGDDGVGHRAEFYALPQRTGP